MSDKILEATQFLHGNLPFIKLHYFPHLHKDQEFEGDVIMRDEGDTVYMEIGTSETHYRFLRLSFDEDADGYNRFTEPFYKLCEENGFTDRDFDYFNFEKPIGREFYCLCFYVTI